MTEGWQAEWVELINKYFPNEFSDWDGMDPPTIKIILDSQIKIEKITAFAKNLAYSNPHVSWQLKQLLRDAPEPEPTKPKTVTYRVSCSKCDFEQDHEEESLEKIKQIHEDWNDNNKAKMDCVHDYQYKLVSQK